MAQRVQVLLEDDLDGSKANETIQFGLDGTSYEIDLSTKNAGKLRDQLGGWAQHARKVRGSAVRRAKAGKPARSDLGKVREWARANGYQVSDRGRVSAQIQDAYDQANHS